MAIKPFFLMQIDGMSYGIQDQNGNGFVDSGDCIAIDVDHNGRLGKKDKYMDVAQAERLLVSMPKDWGVSSIIGMHIPSLRPYVSAVNRIRQLARQEVCDDYGKDKSYDASRMEKIDALIAAVLRGQPYNDDVVTFNQRGTFAADNILQLDQAAGFQRWVLQNSLIRNAYAHAAQYVVEALLAARQMRQMTKEAAMNLYLKARDWFDKAGLGEKERSLQLCWERMRQYLPGSKHDNGVA